MSINAVLNAPKITQTQPGGTDVSINWTVNAHTIQNPHSPNFVNFLSPIDLTGSITGVTNCHNCIFSKNINIPPAPSATQPAPPADFITIKIPKYRPNASSTLHVMNCTIEYTYKNGRQGMSLATVKALLSLASTGPNQIDPSITPNVLLIQESNSNNAFSIVDSHLAYRSTMYFRVPGQQPADGDEFYITITNNDTQPADVFATIRIVSTTPILSVS